MKYKAGYYFLIVISLLLCYMIKQYMKIYQAEQEEQNKIHQLEQRKMHVDDREHNPSYQTEKSDTINRANIFSYNVTNVTEFDKDTDCILYIDEIQLSKFVYNGTKRTEHLNQYDLVTATDDMQYANGGNYIICGHASRLYGHSLNRLKEVKKGYHITIKTNQGNDQYIVDNVSYQKMMDTDVYCRQSETDELTIISCAKYVSREHYIVIHARKDN